MASKLVTYAELKAHSTKDSLYILLHEKGMWHSLSPYLA